MRFRVVTYNLQRGIYYGSLRDHFLSCPELCQADVVAVQEALLPDGGENTLARLARDLGNDYRWTYRTVMAYPGKEYGNGFLFRSSMRPLDARVVQLPSVGRLDWVARVKTEGGRPDTKSAFAQVFTLGERRIRVTSVHLDFAGGVAHRVRQLEHLLKVLDGTGGTGPLAADILCGDFNTSGHYRSRRARRGVEHVLRHARNRGYAEGSAEVAWTNDLFSSIDDADPARRLLKIGRALGLRYRQKLDHLLVKGVRAIRNTSAVMGPGQTHLHGSDHLPVAVELEL